MGQDQALGEGLEPAAQCLQGPTMNWGPTVGPRFIVGPSYNECPAVLLDQAGSLLRSRSRQRMGDRLGEQPVLFVPATGATMQLRDQRGGRLLQPLAQSLSKQVVIAIPAPFVVEGDEKHIGMLQEVEQGLAAVLCPHRIAQRGAEALQ